MLTCEGVPEEERVRFPRLADKEEERVFLPTRADEKNLSARNLLKKIDTLARIIETMQSEKEIQPGPIRGQPP